MCMCVYVCVSVFLLGIELRELLKLGKHSTTEVHPSAFKLSILRTTGVVSPPLAGPTFLRLAVSCLAEA